MCWRKKCYGYVPVGRHTLRAIITPPRAIFGGYSLWKATHSSEYVARLLNYVAHFLIRIICFLHPFPGRPYRHTHVTSASQVQRSDAAISLWDFFLHCRSTYHNRANANRIFISIFSTIVPRFNIMRQCTPLFLSILQFSLFLFCNTEVVQYLLF